MSDAKNGPIFLLEMDKEGDTAGMYTRSPE
jgi:hypothetical protein